MHARTALLGNPLPCFMLPLFALLCTSENCKSLKDASEPLPECCGRLSTKQQGHQLRETGYRPNIRLSAKCLLSIGTEYGRSTILSCEKLLLLQRSTNRAWQCICKKMFATTSLIMFKTQRSVVLDPRATNHAFQCMMAKGAKCAIQYQMKCTKTHRGTQPLSCLIKRQGMHTQCNAT